eukprot:2560825-Amphidinium_carterae.1
MLCQILGQRERHEGFRSYIEVTGDGSAKVFACAHPAQRRMELLDWNLRCFDCFLMNSNSIRVVRKTLCANCRSPMWH